MRKVELVPGIRSSILGFGCAPIMGAVDKAASLRALALALDHGINHFDVARCYGFGEAEAVVGAALRAQRDKVVIASKFGIQATLIAQLLRPVKPMFRRVKRFLTRGKPQRGSPGLTPVKPFGASPQLLLRKVEVNAAGLIQSVETSLRKLHTDRIDYLFLHEPLVPVQAWEQVQAAVLKLKQQGKVRAFGLAFMLAEAAQYQPYLKDFELLQHDWRGDYLKQRTTELKVQVTPTIFFAPFKNSQNRAPEEVLANIFTSIPNCVVLASMFNPKHLSKNCRAAESL